jgi:hypothetical protein
MANAALEALRTLQRELAADRADDVPAGWMTVDQWAKDAGLSRPQTAKILSDSASSQLIECREFRITTGHGVRSVKHYKAK